MKPEGCEAQTLRALASMPFLDRTEMVAVTGWSKAAVHEAVDKLDSGGFCAAVPHATALFPSPTGPWSSWPAGTGRPWPSRRSGGAPLPCFPASHSSGTT